MDGFRAQAIEQGGTSLVGSKGGRGSIRYPIKQLLLPTASMCTSSIALSIEPAFYRIRTHASYEVCRAITLLFQSTEPLIAKAKIGQSGCCLSSLTISASYRRSPPLS